MPIGPEHGDKEMQEEYEKVCKIIDSWLEKNDTGHPVVYVSIKLKTISQKVKRMVDDAYRKAGWKSVNFTNDPGKEGILELKRIN